MNVTLLMVPTPALSPDNYLLLGNALRERGHHVTLASVDGLSLIAGGLRVQARAVSGPLRAGAPFEDLPPAPVCLDEQDLVWLLGLGRRDSFLDKLQLLSGLRAPLVNSVDALLHLKSKYRLARLPAGLRHPQTHASRDWSELHDMVLSHDRQWIVKPPAGSFGRDVFRVSRSDPNCKAILQTLTGPAGERYCLLQEYVPAIEAGEKRVLFSAGRVVGQYLRVRHDDHRTNLSQGGRASACDLTSEERALCERIGAYLFASGAWFAALDLVHPYIIEFNVANPGGLDTLRQLTGEDRSHAVVDAVLAALGRGTPGARAVRHDAGRTHGETA
jgi:glutathione synthase